MSTPLPARLYQKKSGVFYVRVLLATTAAARADKAHRKELRCTLRTKNRVFARTVCSYMNAMLEHVPVGERATAVSKFLSHEINTWTLPGGLSADGEEDQERLLRFLAQKPEIERAVIESIRKLSGADPKLDALLMLLSERAQGGVQAHATATPSRTMRYESAVAAYEQRYKDGLKSQNDRTSEDHVRLLKNFRRFVEQNFAELGANPLVHLIETRHISAFLDGEAKRPGRGQPRKDNLPSADAAIDGQTKRGGDSQPRDSDAECEGDAASDEDKNKQGVKAITLLKKLGELRHFFRFLLAVEQVVTKNPVDGMADAEEVWAKRAALEDAPYAPFTADQIARMFDPEFYLANTRSPDHFWSPLLGAHLGCRLGEFVDNPIDWIGYDAAAECWYIDVKEGKNPNSVRRLPITEPLERLGFVDYVKHVKKMRASYELSNA